MSQSLCSVELRSGKDVVFARQQARYLAGMLGFDVQDQACIAAAVSEVARNAWQYAKGGRAEFFLDLARPQALIAEITDHGPGIPELKTLLQGTATSHDERVTGIPGIRRLMDQFTIDSGPKGTVVRFGKQLRRGGLVEESILQRIQQELKARVPEDPLAEVQRQNQELLATLHELRQRQQDVEQLGRELEETNRGVVALYAELDERADYLRRASELKSRFLSNMTHEFRTPLNSILSLSRLLLDRIDGDLNPEQEKQTQFIQKAATDLSDLVNDLLDLAKVEAGKEVVRPTTFTMEDLFVALRGTTRPLLAPSPELTLIFETSGHLPALRTDERKLSQILRNFISNAIKYTSRGEIRVSAALQSPREVIISVADTGIGIAPEDQERVFEEFTQIDSPLQRKAKGTGLGLPLARKLAELLGGRVSLRSEPGIGSTFSVVLPLDYRGPSDVIVLPENRRRKDPGRTPILAVDDNNETLLLYENHFQGTRFQVLPAQSIREARESIKMFRPVAILLDILLGTENSWEFLEELRRDPSTRHIPIFVLSVVKNAQKAIELGATDFHPKPVPRDWLLGKMDQVMRSRPKEVLIIDDDEISRYLLKGLLAGNAVSVVEAGSGREGLTVARELRPSLIFLDIMMPEFSGFDVLDQLKADSRTREIPVAIHTAKLLTDEERDRLEASACLILTKNQSEREQTQVQINTLLEQVIRKSV